MFCKVVYQIWSNLPFSWITCFQSHFSWSFIRCLDACVFCRRLTYSHQFFIWILFSTDDVFCSKFIVIVPGIYWFGIFGQIGDTLPFLVAGTINFRIDPVTFFITSFCISRSYRGIHSALKFASIFKIYKWYFVHANDEISIKWVKISDTQASRNKSA
jgi:hypothetical protein